MTNIETSQTNPNTLNSKSREFLRSTYEGYKSLIRDIPLKVQEIKGQISDKAFDFLIEADIQRSFILSPPIPGEFSPNSPEFYKKNARQTESMAYCRIMIERLIAHYPNVPVEKLKSLLSRFAEKYELPKNRSYNFNIMLDKFNSSRNNIYALKESDPNNELFIDFFKSKNLNLEDNFKFRTSPYCYIIYTTPENISKLNPGTAGYFFRKIFDLKDKGIIEVPYIVVPFQTNPESKRILIHEIEHAKNNSLMSTETSFKIPHKLKFPVSDATPDRVIQIWREYLQSRNDLMRDLENLPPENIDNQIITEQRTKITSELARITEYGRSTLLELRNLVKLRAHEIFYDCTERVRDEIIAMKRDGVSNYYELLGIDKNYEYRMDELEEEIRQYAEAGLPIFYNIPLYSQKKFFDTVKKSINAFDRLVDLGYSREMAVAILSTSPILLWPKIVEGLAKAKE